MAPNKALKKKSKRARDLKLMMAVPKPTPKYARSGFLKTKRIQSLENRREKELQKARNLAQKFKKFAQVIRVPFTLEHLNKTFTAAEKNKLEAICDNELGPSQESQCISAQFIDKDGQPILFYFDERVITVGEEDPPKEIKLKNQYKQRTQAYLDGILETDKVRKVFDGLHPMKCELYHIATQNLVRDLPLHKWNDNTRHGGGNVMDFAKEGRYHEPDTKEHAGVVRLVHCWPMQAQKKKGLYISGDISHSSSSLAGTASYYHITRDIAISLGAMFEATFPDVYKEYKAAFEAGVWVQEDPGPFIGRSIIYKLQSKLHRDKNDVGPSVSFPVGYFGGGEMLLPQLKTKLRYGPGSVCIFYSSILFHKVSTFIPLAQTVNQSSEAITPGRIGSVFFFPKDSLDTLKGKPKNWGRETNFGRNESLLG